MEQAFYPLNPPNRRRPTGKEMQVLCLGLSRSGTDSLCAALLILGTSKVYHGFVITAHQREDCAFWVPLMRRKFSTNGKNMAIDFDSVLGDCEAVTDGPCYVFAEELLSFYPNAKVVLNRRRNEDAWYQSMIKTCLEVFSWPMWVLSWFDTGIYWLWYNFDLVMNGYYVGDFKSNGKRVSAEHYGRLESALTDTKRPYLDWTVEEGWKPLCEFLGKPIPDVPFPNGNKGDGQFQDNMKEATKDIVMNALHNISIVLVILIAVAISTSIL